jgi:hypothetical protein
VLLRAELLEKPVYDGRRLAELPLWYASPPYRLLVTGHSLGAGVATVLALLLRRDLAARVRVECYAYSPPGSTLDLASAAWAEDFITSLVVGSDMVSRLSMRTLLALKRDMLAALHATNQAKYWLNGGVCGTAYGCGKVTPWWGAEVTDSDEPGAAILAAEFAAASRRAAAGEPQPFPAPLAESHPKNNATHHHHHPRHPRHMMTLPGRVVHLVKVDATQSCLGLSQQRVYRPIWRDRAFFAAGVRRVFSCIPCFLVADFQQKHLLQNS